MGRCSCSVSDDVPAEGVKEDIPQSSSVDSLLLDVVLENLEKADIDFLITPEVTYEATMVRTEQETTEKLVNVLKGLKPAQEEFGMSETDYDFTSDDIFYNGESPAIKVETGRKRPFPKESSSYTDKEYAYDTFISCEGMQFDVESRTTYRIVKETVFYEEDGSYFDSTYKIMTCYDYLTGGQVNIYD